MLAAKHLDPVIGIDVHIVLIPTPAGPVPTPIPHPFVGMVFDPLDYVPQIGATVLVNGLPRAQAGSAVMAMPPHIPMGGMFLKPPGNEGEVFMGSSTVVVDGEPMTYGALPALTCTDVGMPAPARLSRKSMPKTLMLPTSTVMAIPGAGLVMIGGAPTISMPGPEILLGPIAKRLGKQMRKMKRLRTLAHLLHRKARVSSRYLNKVADRVFAKLKLNKSGAVRNAVSRAICTVTGHPVDVATGKLFTEFVDLELLGPLPFKLERVWYSTSTYDGPLGHGWHAPFDMALAVDREVIGVRLEDGRMALFPALAAEGQYFHTDERLTLHRDSSGYRLHNAHSGLTHYFASSRGGDVLPLVRLENREGHSVAFRYDERGRLREIRDAGARSWELSYHAGSHRIARLIGPHPDREHERVVYVRYTYDESGNLCEVRDALEQPQRFAYAHHLLVRETNRNGLSFYFEYDGKDASARCVHTWGDGGIYDHKLHYDLARKITTVENSLGAKTQFEHDGSMVKRTVDAFGNTTRTKYSDGYRIVERVDELGSKSEYAYDARGNLIVSREPEGSCAALTYDAHDLPATLIDARGGAWRWIRDDRGRIIEQVDPLGRVTTYAYDGPMLVGTVDPAGGHTKLRYGRTGELESLIRPDGSVTRFEYDQLGRLLAVHDARGAVQRRGLDLLGRAVRVEEPDGNVRQLAYDGEGNVTRARDRERDVRFCYQGMNRLASRSEGRTVVRFTYDTEERLTGIVNEHGYAYRFVLGPTGQVDEERRFDGLIRKYTRDAAGRIVRIDRAGQLFSELRYDSAGRVVTVTHSDGSHESFAYDAAGALAEATNAETTVRFERDLVGRVIAEWQGEHVVRSEYDRLDRRVQLRSSLGAEQNFERNIMGDVLRVDAGGFEVQISRDNLGLELERALPGGLQSRWRRDEVGRPTEHVVGRKEGQALHAVGYDWETAFRLVGQFDALRGPIAYRHDPRGKLATAAYPDGSAELRMPDAVGNLFRSEHRADRKYGPAGQLLISYTPQGETHYAYDPEGNLIEKREPNGVVWRYQWNASGMLRAVTRPDGSIVTFAYDALGRRIAKTYRGQTTRWIWDGNVPLHEWVEGVLISLADACGVPWVTADAAIKKREAELAWLLAQGPPTRGSVKQPLTWLFDPESFTPMAKLSASGALSIVCDHLGTPVLMANHDCEPVWSASLNTWGELRLYEGERLACPFRWPGQYEDAETGLYYNRFRYYDPEAGQYTSQDPIGLAGGAALYAYVHDPLTWVDPFGLSGNGSCGAGRGISPIVEGGGLVAHEVAGGHLLARHVGKSTAELAARLAAETRIPAASTFLSRAEAEAAMAGLLNANAIRISSWAAAGARGRLTFDGAFSGGSVLMRGASSPTTGSGVRAVLQGSGGGGWNILTGFPLP
jgi:RHS repeat-associated protein